jgi:hypothetical protein
MTREQVEELAKARAEKLQILTGLQILNVYGKKPSELVEMDARYQMAKDEFVAAEKAYRNGMTEYLLSTAARSAPL